MTELDNLIKSFVEHCTFEKNLSTKSIKAYKIDLNQFKAYIENKHTEIKIASINKDILKDYLSSLYERYKIKSVKRKIACLKSFFSFLEFEDIILVNPFRKMKLKIKEPLRIPKALTAIEIQNVIYSAYKEALLIKNKNSFSYKAIIRDIAVMELLFASGFRVSEICNLLKRDIDTNSWIIKINGKGNKERIIYIENEEVRSAIIKYIDLFDIKNSSTEFLFINRLRKMLSEQSVRFMVKKYSVLAGIDKHVTPHTFRHTFATLLLEEGVDIKYIQSFLGHSSLMTTQIYTQVNKEKQKEILSTKHPRKNFSVANKG